MSGATRATVNKAYAEIKDSAWRWGQVQNIPHRRGSATQIIPKLPPYGKALAARQQFKNMPFLVVICVGQNCWQNAKQWKARPDISPLVLTSDQSPNALHWPVTGCSCIIEWDNGPGKQLIVELINQLLYCGAKSVTVRPLFVNRSISPWLFNIEQQCWMQCREIIRTYFAPVSDSYGLFLTE